MALSSGSHLGPYEILSSIGAGGMGEVYKARDTRLDRTVAIKVLSTHLSSNPDLRQRFDREAKAISSLNHPHICTLHDVGNQDGVDYLVMEYLEGETLTTRLEKGSLGQSETLRFSVQIAEALDRAHKQGLIHRDLKPGNIMLTKNGAKILDFGLAKISEGTGSNLHAMQTRTTPLTTEGAIVGTLQYMSPEQLEGKEADARSDIFAFGAILYEMSTGHRAFEGKSQASLIASILKEEPRSIIEQQPLTSPALERVVRQCLAKDPEDRWQTASDLKNELRWISGSGSLVLPAGTLSGASRKSAWARWAVSGLLLVVVGLLGGYIWKAQSAPPQTMVQFTLEPQADMKSIRWPRISPDGKTLAVLGFDSAANVQKIWIRRMGELHFVPLAGTDNPGRPFWSPDSKYLGYFSDGKLFKAPVDGGSPQRICNAPGGADGCWGANDVILFDGATTDSIRMVSAGGGEIGAATSINRAEHEAYHMWPTMLPDGEHFLYGAEISMDSAVGGTKRAYFVASLKGDGKKQIGDFDGRVEYDPRGYILFARDGSLFARKFDLGALSCVGDAFLIAERIRMEGGEAGHFSVSNAGILAFANLNTADNSEIFWVDRNGKDISKVGQPGPYGDIRLSPDEKRLTIDRFDSESNSDIWIYELDRDISTRFTFDTAADAIPSWSPDGARIAFGSMRRGAPEIYVKNSSGLGDETLLMPRDSATQTVLPNYWAPDGKSIYTMQFARGDGKANLYAVDVDSPFTKHPIVVSQFNEIYSAPSSDGKYLAYCTNESGKMEVYVRSIEGSSRWRISSEGGFAPLFRRDGAELFYLSETAIYAVPITYTPEFTPGAPKKLFDVRLSNRTFNLYRYQVSADGQKILVNRQINQAQAPSVVVRLNWSAPFETK